MKTRLETSNKGLSNVNQPQVERYTNTCQVRPVCVSVTTTRPVYCTFMYMYKNNNMNKNKINHTKFINNNINNKKLIIII